MKVKLFSIFIFCYLFTITHAKKHHHSSEEEEKEDPTHKAMDRLAVNLAGAFVKSIFPEMDRSGAPSALPIAGSQDPIAVSNPVDIRRAPQHTALLQEASGPAFDTMNAFNSRYGGNVPAASVLSAVNSPNYGLQMPSSFGGGGASYGPSAASNLPLPTSQLVDLIPSIPNSLNMAPGGSVEAINALKRQKYLTELQNHQNQLNDYSAKQLEYLDQQRRYQQQMVDHQAGAALLMQQQQQTYLNGMKNKYANFEEAPNKETLEDSQTNAKVLLRSKDPVRQHAVRTAAHEEFSKKNSQEREDFASDEFLKAFFKKNYGIEIPNEGAMKKLSSDERDTLNQLKEHLIKEAKENGIKFGAIKTMEKFSEKGEVKHIHHEEGENLEKELASLSEDECGKCIAPQAHKLKGSWTQIYGNSKVMRETYSQLLTLMSIENFDEDFKTANLTTKHASCVGMEIGKIHKGTAPLNFFFRDDGEKRELHEINGNFEVLSNKELQLNLDNMNTKLCVVKAGPFDEPQFEYVVFAETSGSNKCSSYFVFARNVEEFNDRYYDDIADFMKSQVLDEEALPVAALSKPALCQL